MVSNELNTLQPISDEPSKSSGIKSQSMKMAVVQLVSLFSCLAYDWAVKDE
jgi:hypothetical protein